jgi:hypothetical protein
MVAKRVLRVIKQHVCESENLETSDVSIRADLSVRTHYIRIFVFSVRSAVGNMKRTELMIHWFLVRNPNAPTEHWEADKFIVKCTESDSITSL